MSLWKDFLRDKAGAVVSAELVLVGTVAVLGSVVGLNTVSTAIDSELREFASAIRSLDQSYGYVGHSSCRAWSAGSSYIQPRVEQSLHDLCATGTADPGLIREHVEAERAAAAGQPVQSSDPNVSPTPIHPAPPPNELPTPAPKPKDATETPKSNGDHKPVKPPKKGKSKGEDDDV